MLRSLGENIWEARGLLGKTGKYDLGTRMTVVRLTDGGLWLHSPIRLDEKLQQDVMALGTVKYVVAPNQYHHLFVSPWLRAFPKAELACVKDLLSKRKDLKPTYLLDSDERMPWEGELPTLVIRGSKLISEAEFFHKDSKTLIMTDFAFNLRPYPSFWFNTFLRIWGIYNRFSPSVLVKLFSRDRAAIRRAFAIVSTWDFNRIIVSHGDIVETGAKEKLREAFAWIGAK